MAQHHCATCGSGLRWGGRRWVTGICMGSGVLAWGAPRNTCALRVAKGSQALWDQGALKVVCCITHLMLLLTAMPQKQ